MKSETKQTKDPVNTAVKRTELALCENSLVPLLSWLWTWFSSDGVSMVIFVPSGKNASFEQLLSSYLPPLLSLLSLALLPARLCSVSRSCSLLHVRSFFFVSSCLTNAPLHYQSFPRCGGLINRHAHLLRLEQLFQDSVRDSINLSL